MTAGRSLPSAAEISDRLDALRSRLARAAEAGGHDPARLRIVAVTKGWPAAVCRAALEAGCEILAESRVQEGEPKVEALRDAEWHFVGRLQSNKVRRALRAFSTIHSVDSAALLRRIDEVARDEGLATRLLLQVNVSGEGSKAGLEPVALGSVALPGTARLVGLMTIAPMDVGHEGARAVFRRLREHRDALQQRMGLELPELSMGMSSDAEAGAAEGATMVRVGTALFGPRG